MSEPCGCESRQGHADPHADPILHTGHGERDAAMGDPPPYAVPGSAGPNSWQMPDAYCLCGHPNYLSCEAWANGGGILGLTMHNVGGYYLTTREGAS